MVKFKSPWFALARERLDRGLFKGFANKDLNWNKSNLVAFLFGRFARLSQAHFLFVPLSSRDIKCFTLASSKYFIKTTFQIVCHEKIKFISKRNRDYYFSFSKTTSGFRRAAVHMLVAVSIHKAFLHWLYRIAVTLAMNTDNNFCISIFSSWKSDSHF